MKGRFFWMALFLIGLSWTVNTIYAYSKQLDEPVFLDHYIDKVVYEDTFLTFYYLTNKNDISRVSHVNLGDVTGYISNDEFDFGFGFDYEDNPNIDVFTHHVLRSIHIELNPDELEDSLKEGPLTFNEIDVHFNDGKTMTASIGEITIHPNFPTDNVLDPRSSSGSNDGSSEHMYIVEQDHYIESISVNFDKVLQDYLFIKIDSSSRPATKNYIHTNSDGNTLPGVDIRDVEFPYKLDKGENLYIYTLISPDFIGVLDSSIILTGTTTSGKAFTTYSPFNSQEPYLEQKGVDKIIKGKIGGGNR